MGGRLGTASHEGAESLLASSPGRFWHLFLLLSLLTSSLPSRCPCLIVRLLVFPVFLLVPLGRSVMQILSFCREQALSLPLGLGSLLVPSVGTAPSLRRESGFSNIGHGRADGHAFRPVYYGLFHSIFTLVFLSFSRFLDFLFLRNEPIGVECLFWHSTLPLLIHNLCLQECNSVCSTFLALDRLIASSKRLICSYLTA